MNLAQRIGAEFNTLRGTELVPEINARIAADTTLIANLANEASTRAAADTTLTDNLNTEKGRIDAILSASNTDADTFAEIVALVNSVDTTNDQAFAAYALANDAVVALNTAKVSNIDHPTVSTAVPVGALFTDTNTQLTDSEIAAMGFTKDVNTDTVYDDTMIQNAVALNTAKVSNIDHPLVEVAVPLGAVFTDTIVDISGKADQATTYTKVEVDTLPVDFGYIS